LQVFIGRVWHLLPTQNAKRTTVAVSFCEWWQVAFFFLFSSSSRGVLAASYARDWARTQNTGRKGSEAAKWLQMPENKRSWENDVESQKVWNLRVHAVGRRINWHCYLLLLGCTNRSCLDRPAANQQSRQGRPVDGRLAQHPGQAALC
jgi:hypothetical protein